MCSRLLVSRNQNRAAGPRRTYGPSRLTSRLRIAGTVYFFCSSSGISFSSRSEPGTWAGVGIGLEPSSLSACSDYQWTCGQMEISAFAFSDFNWQPWLCCWCGPRTGPWMVTQRAACAVDFWHKKWRLDPFCLLYLCNLHTEFKRKLFLLHSLLFH